MTEVIITKDMCSFISMMLSDAEEVVEEDEAVMLGKIIDGLSKDGCIITVEKDKDNGS